MRTVSSAPIFFEGMSCFHFRDGLIAHYSEAFDRGIALVQLDFPAARIKRVLEKTAAAQNRSPEARQPRSLFPRVTAKGGATRNQQRRPKASCRITLHAATTPHHAEPNNKHPTEDGQRAQLRRRHRRGAGGGYVKDNGFAANSVVFMIRSAREDGIGAIEGHT